MTFSIEHDFDDLYVKMNRLKIFNDNLYTSILKKTVKPLMDELDRNGPDSLRSFATSDGGDYNRAAEASRAKYGELQKSLGVYKSRTTNSQSEHAVNVGYLNSKQDKAFVARFLNYGWKHARSGNQIRTRWQGWMQKAEDAREVEMRGIFDSLATEIFEKTLTTTFETTKMRKVL